MRALTMLSKSRELTSQQFALTLSIPVILCLLLIMAFPFGYALWLSFREVSLFGGFSTEYVGLENYVEAVKAKQFWRSLEVTFRFVGYSVLLTISIGLGMALLMNRVRRGAAVLGTIIILPWSISLYGAGVMWQYLARGQTGFVTALVNNITGNTDTQNAVEYSLLNKSWIVELIALANSWNLAPLVAFFLLASLKTIPSRLYDLATIDRLTPMQKFWHVTLPPLKYSLFVFTVIVFILSMKLLDFIFVIAQGGPGGASTTTSYYVYELAFRQTSYGYSAAVSFYLLFLIITGALSLYFFWGRKLED